VSNSITSVEVETDGFGQPLGDCFVYQYIDGTPLDKYWFNENYADKLIILDRVMPQLLRGKSLIYVACHMY
jgi:hypothetical protein